MRSKLKMKLIISFCIGCILFMGAAFRVNAAGALTIAVSSQAVQTGDTVTVTVYAAGADNAAVTADMNITYDTSMLEYVSSSASSASGGGGKVTASASNLEIKFKAVGSGDAYVKAEASTLTAAGAHITVSGSSGTDTASPDAAKSGDNSLSSLTLSQGTLSPAFKGSVTEYTAEVGSDVNDITVTPVTSNSKAEIVSISGNKDLKEGKNVITVLVRAENGTEASYKITVTKGNSVAASSGSAGVSDITGSAAEQVTDGDGGSTASGNVSGDAIVIDGVNYKISEDFTEEDIPEGFTRTDFEYKGNPYQGVIFDFGHLGLYYLVNDAGEGRFFVYDADRDKFYPYVRLSSGDHFIILMVVPNAVIPPDNYEETVLPIGDVTNIAAYQYAGTEDDEIVKTDENSDSRASDFYIFYGMDNTGVSCWYQYDIKQGTYQRFNEEAISSSDSSEDYESLVNSYNELNERYKTTRTKDRRIIVVMIFVLVVLLILILNLLLKVRDLRSDEREEYEEPKPIKKSRPAPPKKKKTYSVVEEPKEDTDFYDGDDADFIDEFEEEPAVLSRRTRKKEKPAAKKAAPQKMAPVKTEPVVNDDDDDIEFLDLNDL